jgi:hypothetical protein
MGKPSKRKYLKGLLERTRLIQAAHPEPQTFDALIVWIEQRLERSSVKNSR